eukprot:2235033-Prymnesium_polylepis.1
MREKNRTWTVGCAAPTGTAVGAAHTAPADRATAPNSSPIAPPLGGLVNSAAPTICAAVRGRGCTVAAPPPAPAPAQTHSSQHAAT